MTVAKHKPRKCEALMRRICHCLTRSGSKFHACCGWYCNDCNGRIQRAPYGRTA